VRDAEHPSDVAVQLCPLGLLLSAHRHVVWCNPAFAALFGYSVDDLTGRSLEPLYPSTADFERIGGRGLQDLTSRGTYDDERLMREQLRARLAEQVGRLATAAHMKPSPYQEAPARIRHVSVLEPV
jgi:PAS domain-containing protein